MKKVQILGTGCAKCRKLTENTRDAAQVLGVDIELEKVSDLAEIMKFGILNTPGLVIDGKLIASGRLLKPDEIMPHLRSPGWTIGVLSATTDSSSGIVPWPIDGLIKRENGKF